MADTRTHKAGKNHGPCDHCGLDIERGHLYSQTYREYDPDRDRKDRKQYFKGSNGKRLVLVKKHSVCKLGR